MSAPRNDSSIRIIIPAILLLGQSFAFLLLFRNALGGVTGFIVPHATLSVFLVGSIYGLAICAHLAFTHRIPRMLSLGSLALIATVFTTVFYLVAMFTLYGFRDLPTLGVISGYFTQIPSMATSLPVGKTLIALALLALIFGIALITTVITWGLEGLRHKLIAPGSTKPSVLVAIAPSFVLAFLLLVPPVGFLDQHEPWLRSLYNRPLAESGLGLQSNPIEEATDRRIEASYPTTPMGERRNVILIYIDGLRSDVLQPYGSRIENMPFMSNLVATGQLTQFPRAFASCSMTLCGLGSILQSRPAHRVSPDNLSLPKVLRRQGYQTRYLLSGDHQHFLALKKYYGPDYDFYMDGIDLNPAKANDDLAVFNELSRLPDARSAKTPQFIMLGLMSVHIWGKRHQQFRRWLPDKLTTISFDNIDDNSTEAYRNNYMNGILQADFVLEKIWTWLNVSGYLKDSIIVITSDHGDSLGENGRLGHARSLNTPELLIPLWIHDPTQTLRPVSPVFQDDIAVTILDLLKLPKPESWTGHSLAAPLPDTRWLPIYYINSQDKFGLILSRDGRTLKYLVDYGKNTESVYDLDHDLFENNNILQTLPQSSIEEFRMKLQSTFGTLLPNS